MKILLILIIFFCSSKENKTEIIEQRIVQPELEIREEKKVIKSNLTFEGTQDSLRSILLKSKPNETLKSSLLQELYIRGLVNQVNDKIYFKLPFNLHGLDCGAPDCYSTNISFDIPAGNPIVFPEKIDFRLFEHGCVEQEIIVNAIFELEEQSAEFVNYYSKELKSNLIIKKGTDLYYYPHQKPSSVKVESIDKMFETYEFEKENVIVPYRSTSMMTNEYEYFMKNE